MSPYSSKKQIVVLEFKPHEQSGTPRLELIEPAGLASNDQLQPWNEELNPKFEELASGGTSRRFRFSSRIAGLPQDYDVESKPTRFHGMPKLVLTSREPVEVEPARKRSFDEAYADDSANWRNNGRDRGASAYSGTLPGRAALSRGPRGVDLESVDRLGRDFIATLRKLLDNVPQNASQDAGMRAVLAEMADLVKEQPLDWLLLTMSGYLQLAQRFGSGGQRDLAFMEASHLIDELCDVRLQHLRDKSDADRCRLFIRNAGHLWRAIRDS